MLMTKRILHKALSDNSDTMHAKRLNSLVVSTNSAIQFGKVSLSGLGRHMIGHAKVKNKIKRVDRLLGNRHLYSERIDIYRAQARRIVGGFKEIAILVDWSPCSSRKFHIIKASLVVDGRSLTLYEEVHPESLLCNKKIHQTFLTTLKGIIPEGCHVIIVTDAGFKNTWFKQLEKLGWDWIGRVRNSVHYKLKGENDWQDSKTLHKHATKIPKCLGESQLAKHNVINCSLYLYKSPAKGRIKLSGHGTRAKSSMEKRYKDTADEPWVLATSLNGGRKITKRVINLYKKRMQIEQNFRDVKNQRLGMSLSESRTLDANRLQILLEPISKIISQQNHSAA